MVIISRASVSKEFKVLVDLCGKSIERSVIHNDASIPARGCQCGTTPVEVVALLSAH